MIINDGLVARCGFVFQSFVPAGVSMGECRRWRMASECAHFPTAVDARSGVRSDGRQSPVAQHVLSARARVADLTPRSRHAPCRAACMRVPHVPVAPVLIIHSLPSRRRLVASDPSRRLDPPFVRFLRCGGDQETVAASALSEGNWREEFVRMAVSTPLPSRARQLRADS